MKLDREETCDMIQWKPEYAIGIEVIDEQHKKLFDIAEEAEELLLLPERIDKFDEIMKIIQELKDYVVFHFAEEEKIIKEIGYKKFFTHCIYHHDFVIALREMKIDDIDEKQDEHIHKLLQMVNSWLVAHVTKEDVLWAEVYKQKA